MFSGLWAKIVAALSVAVSVLLMIIRYKNRKIDKLNEENAKHEKKEEITNTIEKAEKKNEEIAEKEKAAIDDSDWRNQI